MKKLKKLLGGFLFCLLLAGAFGICASAMNSVNRKEDIVIYRNNGTQAGPEDFFEKVLVLAYGRTSCPNTKNMLTLTAMLRSQGYSVQGVLMDVDSSQAELDSYEDANPYVAVAHHSSYNSQMWSLYRELSGAGGSSMTLPLTLVLDENRTIVGWSTGYDSSLTALVKSLAGEPDSDSGNNDSAAGDQNGRRYKITYHLNGGKQDSRNPDYYYAGDSIPLYDPVREGYTFQGWAVEEYAGNYMVYIYPHFQEDFTLNAVWKKNPQPPKPKLNKTKVTLDVGKTYQLRLSNAPGKVTWKSVNSSIVSVSSSGKIKAKKSGKISVRATCQGKSYKCTVTVLPAKQKLSYAKSRKAGSVTLKWKKDKAAKGYQISYSTDKRFRKSVKNIWVKNISSYSRTLTGLKKGKTYYFRVRSYGTWKNTRLYGDYSSTVKVTVRRK